MQMGLIFTVTGRFAHIFLNKTHIYLSWGFRRFLRDKNMEEEEDWEDWEEEEERW